jgi:hypothetical protein
VTANNTTADSKLEHMSDTSKPDHLPLLTVMAQKASAKILVMVINFSTALMLMSHLRRNETKVY